MHRRALPFAVLLFACAACGTTRPGQPSFTAEVEGGMAWQTRNDVAIPGDTGTRFALDELTGSGPFPVGRLEFSWWFAERHELRAVVAPLEFSGEGSLDAPVSFAGQSFAAGTKTDAKFRFDSYRLTYRYRVHESPQWEWRAGLTANVRDAEIELEQGATMGRKTDTGLVPLLNVAGSWHFATDWRLALDVDTAVAPQGRATDAALKSYWQIREGLELGMGYRTIEGGADNDEVYTFAWIHQLVLSLRYAF